ncbi:MAG: RecX family transcriptional regulator [Clostridia bacterium]|nr:RecX family transcriptional regulator [Clostridia bacterium]
MYNQEEFDNAKTKVLKYILYKKRSENEIRTKFAPTIEEKMLDDIIEYLKQAGYIDDSIYIEKTINNFMILKNLSIKEIKYKLLSKGLDKNQIEDYIYSHKDELEEYEKKSAQNIIYKKSSSMEEQELKEYLLKKGYKSDNIEKAFEEE